MEHPDTVRSRMGWSFSPACNSNITSQPEHDYVMQANLEGALPATEGLCNALLKFKTDSESTPVYPCMQHDSFVQVPRLMHASSDRPPPGQKRVREHTRLPTVGRRDGACTVVFSRHRDAPFEAPSLLSTEATAHCQFDP